MGTEKTGRSDIPIKLPASNLLGTGDYVDVLADFIENCATPMTIAIQGDWGTGKTSMLNFLQEKIKDKTITCIFNTWAYSQFDLDDALPLLFLNKLAAELADEPGAKLKEYVFKAAKALGKVALRRADLEDLSLEGFELDNIESLMKLREEFQKTVDARTSKEGKDKVVIFIDDLDRLQPNRAVELLEVIKVFLDCEKCVFVLAVDYQIVVQGVRAKYKDYLSEEKGRNFFDKIIQLPFRMPVEMYTLDNYLKEVFDGLFAQAVGEQRWQQCCRVVQASLGRNPRSIKRLVNSYIIINSVAEKNDLYKDRQGSSIEADQKQSLQQVLLGLLCLQLSYEPVYLYMMEHSREEITGKNGLLSALADEAACKKLLVKAYKKDAEELDPGLVEGVGIVSSVMAQWAEEVCRCFHVKNADDHFCRVLSMTSVTSSADTRKRLRQTEEMEEADFKRALMEIGKLTPMMEAAIAALRDFEAVKKDEGCKMELFGGSYYHARLLSPEGSVMVDVFPRKKNEVAADFMLASSADKAHFEAWIRQALEGKKSSANGKNALSVYGIDKQEVFREALERVWQSRK